MATRLLKPYNLKVIVDNSVSGVCSEVIETSEIGQYETIKSYLASIASQKNVVLSHNASGDLLLTQANGNKQAIYNFDSGAWTKMALQVNGQAMHSLINIKGQVNADTPDTSADAQQLNPYLDNTRFGVGHGGFFPKFRPIVYQQTASTDPNTPPLTARKKLGNELKAAIRLTIDVDGWTLGGVIPMTGDIITVKNPDLFLYQKTKWFIEGVDFRGDAKSDTMTLTCVLPECFNNDEVKNIFKGTNLTVPYYTPGAKATITPFI
jgi:prophage tail gpP-like protein